MSKKEIVAEVNGQDIVKETRTAGDEMGRMAAFFTTFGASELLVDDRHEKYHADGKVFDSKESAANNLLNK